MLWAKIASILMFLAVALGAFGAHALRDKLSAYGLDIFRTAVLYHFVHALGLFVVAWLASVTQDPRLFVAGILFTVGIILFSGSLYVLAVTGVKWLGAITPLGGLSFLAGWIIVFLSVKTHG